jgi:hypothetical protein
MLPEILQATAIAVGTSVIAAIAAILTGFFLCDDEEIA